MRYLWLTLCDPDPQTNGQFLYSGGLVRAAAKAGAKITALGLSRETNRSHSREEPNIRWEFAQDRPLHRYVRLLSKFPSASLRTRVPRFQECLFEHLKSGQWDAIILDSIYVGWALPHVLAYRRRFPNTKVVYLAQNEETQAVLAVARSQRGVRRAAALADAKKTRLLERWLVKSADVVCADSPEDCRLLAGLAGGKSVSFIPPGYLGKPVASRRIDNRLPRRAVVVGSFDWAAKRMALEAFLAAAATQFQRNDVSLQIVGRTEPEYVRSLRERFAWIEVVGSVPDVSPYLADARIGLVPDMLGGFKLKSLDYVFSRTPIFAIEGAMPGTPLENGRGLRLFGDHDQMARGVVDAIDDTVGLNAQQELAFDLCIDRYDWQTIGMKLLRLISPGVSCGAATADLFAISSAPIPTPRARVAW
jgi:glycosyltransferase involved in cell wall biosynthesis